jgi:hypothetical protein
MIERDYHVEEVMTKKPKPVRYIDSENDWQTRDGVATERNGNLTWVEDAETGRGEWRAPHELES